MPLHLGLFRTASLIPSAIGTSIITAVISFVSQSIESRLDAWAVLPVT
jgi:hypothetical protein